MAGQAEIVVVGGGKVEEFGLVDAEKLGLEREDGTAGHYCYLIAALVALADDRGQVLVPRLFPGAEEGGVDGRVFGGGDGFEREQGWGGRLASRENGGCGERRENRCEFHIASTEEQRRVRARIAVACENIWHDGQAAMVADWCGYADGGNLLLPERRVGWGGSARGGVRGGVDRLAAVPRVGCSKGSGCEVLVVWGDSGVDGAGV